MQLEGEVALTIPAVDSLDAFAAEMRRDGIVVIGLADGAVDVRALRQRLGLTQEQFALRYNLGVDNVQRWEQGERTPDRVAMNYLRVIERDPRAAAEAQEVAIFCCWILKKKQMCCNFARSRL